MMNIMMKQEDVSAFIIGNLSKQHDGDGSENVI